MELPVNLTDATTIKPTTAVTTTAPKIKKLKILNPVLYRDICDFIQHYHGLAIDCELDMVDKYFPNVHCLTLKSILQTELSYRVRSKHWSYDSKGKLHRTSFTEQSVDSDDTMLLIKLANMESMSPVTLSRAILQEEYRTENKTQLARLIKYPYLIENHKLAANVIQCINSDNQDGPLIDLWRRVVGEEYEFKLKKMANAAGMHYYDENDLRRMGYDKTPDIKMILPFLYKGTLVNWIESKAMFGDFRTHKFYIEQQLNSYCNRFGTGIVIYWFGYHENLPSLAENNIGITVLDDFPLVQHIERLNLEDSEDNDASTQQIEQENMSTIL